LVEELSAPWGERVRAAAVVGSERERVEGGRERDSGWRGGGMGRSGEESG
jgi:hypothetical protein